MQYECNTRWEPTGVSCMLCCTLTLDCCIESVLAYVAWGKMKFKLDHKISMPVSSGRQVMCMQLTVVWNSSTLSHLDTSRNSTLLNCFVELRRVKFYACLHYKTRLNSTAGLHWVLRCENGFTWNRRPCVLWPGSFFSVKTAFQHTASFCQPWK